MHVGGWFVAAWWHIGLLNDWHLWGYLPHLYHHYTAVCYADYVDFSSAYFVSYTILSYFVRVGIPFSSCILLQSTESGSLPHNHTHSPRLIASAPLLLVIAFATSTPESDCQCSFCYYRLPQLPRVNANVSNNRMHVTYHEPGRFR